MNLMLMVNIFLLLVLKSIRTHHTIESWYRTQEEKRLSVIRDLSSSPARVICDSRDVQAEVFC